MPKGSKKDRQEKHIEESYRKKGRSKEEAERIAYATINKQEHKKKKKD